MPNQCQPEIGGGAFQTIFGKMPVACQLCDINFNVLDCNQSCMDFFGFSDKEEYKAAFCNLSPIVQPCGTASIKKAKQKLEQALKEGFSRFEWTFVGSEENVIAADITIINDGCNEKDNLLIVFRDPDEIYKKREVDRVVKQHIRLMLDSSPLACSIHDKNNNILETNKEAIKLFETGTKQAFVERFIELSPAYQPDGRLSLEKMQEVLRSAMEEGKARIGWMHKTLTGTVVPCEVILERATLGDEDIIISYVRDLREINEALSMVEHLEKLAFIDPLTGAFNRRYFIEEAKAKLDACSYEGHPLSIIMADVDYFKAVNDTFGHDVGDEVLKILVARLRNTLRDSAIVARYGGEEFAVLLPYVSGKKAEEIAWRLRNKIADAPFRITTVKTFVFSVSVSFGVAERKEGDGVADIIKSADNALYQAKAFGRNTVVIDGAIGDID